MTAQVPVEPRTQRHVLVVDDDHDFADSLADLLEPHGFTVRTAPGIREALGALTSFSVDVALVDINLGTESGLGLVPELKDRQPTMVCILMTAYAALDSAVEAVRSGAEDYLLKPLEPDELVEKMRRALREGEERARKQLEQRLLTLGNVCAGVAHDVNNCLQTILIHVGDIEAALAHAPPDGDRARSSAASLIATVRVAADVCRGILTFAKGATTTSGCDAAAALRDSAPLLERATSPGVRLRLRTPPGPLWVPLEAVQLHQIVMNLVMNARHAVGEGGTIDVELRTGASGPASQVHLRVTDDGRGIPESDLSRIFDPYFSTKPVGEGTGLGLSIVHGLVKTSGGEVRVESAIGRGSCFDVMLPLATPARMANATQPSPVATSPGRHLLIVDDLLPMLQAIDKRFRMAGYTTVCADSAEKALSLMKEHGPQVSGVISDVRLPGISGVALAVQLRERWPALPIMLMSGDSGSVPELDHLAPRIALMSKPFELADLLERFEALTAES